MGRFEIIMLSLMSKLKDSMSDYCDLETVDGRNTLVYQDGSMASIIQFNGTRSILSGEQLDYMAGSLTANLTPFMGSRGHSMQFWFKKDLDASETLNEVGDMQRATAARLGLDIDDLIAENGERLGHFVYDEEFYIVLWSRPMLLDPIESAGWRDDLARWRRENNYPAASDAQNLLRPVPYLRDRHNAFVNKIVDDMSGPDFGCSVAIVDAIGALNAIRRSLYPDYTSRSWKAALASTGFALRWNRDDPKDASNLLPPVLPDQIMVGTATVGKPQTSLPDPTTIRLGQRIYAPLLIDTPPRDATHFNALFNALNRSETEHKGLIRSIPYAVSINIEGGGSNGDSFKNVLSSLLSITSTINKNIKLTTAYLDERKRDGEMHIKLSMSAVTWADNTPEGVRELAIRKSKLWRQIESWGSAAVTERAGNPMVAMQSCALALSPRHIQNKCRAPLFDALRLTPITRPSSPFENGSTLMRSQDGKILRYERFSSQQTTWITLFAGRPGMGKSVALNNLNLEACLLPGATELPYLCTLDIGISSRGPVDLLRDALPESRKHLVIYKRLQNTADDAINAFDTPLGLRLPLPKDREFLRNFLTGLVTPPERQSRAYEGMSGFVGRVIDATYRMRSDKFESALPETYKAGHDAEIDEAVMQSGFQVRPATTYWELVDCFFKLGWHHEAEIAQRYAVPLLDHLISAAKSEAIVEEYGSATTEHGRPLIDAFCTGVREAISDFPIFSRPTRFDLGSARVVALDLTDVAPSGSDQAKKQTSLMYLMGRQAFMKKIAFSMEDLPLIPHEYQDFYRQLISRLIDAQKIFCMDEYHKTGNLTALEQQIMTDGREARKWNLELVLASQLMEDFGALTKIATTKFILDSGNAETRNWLRTNIGLSAIEENALINNVKGPGPTGSTFLAQIDTKSGKFSQLFTMTIGPMRLWALSTTAEDRKLRTLLYNAMPQGLARAILAREFPSGSCKSAMERLKEQMVGERDFADESASESLLEQVANNLIATYAEQIAAA